jgi:ketosteroid isomerase-like protein
MVDKVALASQYIKARLAEDNDTVLSLVTDDIVLVSQR